ncbi:membrane protein [Bordetella ansorpii]|uniref:Membrane protein n=1 Tax=Bordetella ansorpii TaxID=288768 RepID=A0A157SGY0_9BORD|nr:DMT family transporter [Bordetella ansorpii]SAI69176.1 membrane protein [Bordetella ansorpii]
MNSADWFRLLALSAVWGASFVFMRVLAPVLGPVATADLRVAIGAVALSLYFLFIGFRPAWRRHWRHYGVIGVFNIGLPFLLFAYAAQYLPAAYSAVINATTPLFGTVFAAWWLGQPFTRGKVVGLGLGLAGVAVITGAGPPAMADAKFLCGVLACLLAAASYAGAGVYIRRFASHVDPLGSAGCGQLLAAAVLAPLWVLAPPAGTLGGAAALNLLGLGLLCSALGFLLYFRLLRDVGPARAMMVAFLTPLFGIAWGILFLGEALTPAILAGGGMIVLSVALILKHSTPARRPPGRAHAPAGFNREARK